MKKYFSENQELRNLKYELLGSKVPNTVRGLKVYAVPDLALPRMPAWKKL